MQNADWGDEWRHISEEKIKTSNDRLSETLKDLGFSDEKIAKFLETEDLKNNSIESLKENDRYSNTRSVSYNGVNGFIREKINSFRQIINDDYFHRIDKRAIWCIRMTITVNTTTTALRSL